MPRGSVPTTPPIFRTVDYGALVRKAFGDSWHKPEIAYRFSNGRTFNDGNPSALYNGTNTS